MYFRDYEQQHDPETFFITGENIEIRDARAKGGSFVELTDIKYLETGSKLKEFKAQHFPKKEFNSDCMPIRANKTMHT